MPRHLNTLAVAILSTFFLSCHDPGYDMEEEADYPCSAWMAEWDMCRDVHFYRVTHEACDDSVPGPVPAAWMVVDTARAFERALHDEDATSATLLPLWREYYESRRECTTD